VLAAALCVGPLLAKAAHLDPLMVSGFWIFLYRARLRDCGRTQWWALGVILLEMAPLLVAGLFGGQSFVYAITHQGVDEAGGRSGIYSVAIVGAFLIQFGFTVWLGSLKGKEKSPLQSATTNGKPSIWEARSWEDDEPRLAPDAPAPAPTRPIDYGAAPQLASRQVRPAFGRRSGA
jgi:uncharacterized membrane protein YhaH (DUF805 family)